jgi:hypothetical protein
MSTFQKGHNDYGPAGDECRLCGNNVGRSDAIESIHVMRHNTGHL